jgi:hypothetical protein
VYSYENKNWDDIEFIVGESNDKKFLLELPGPDKVFSMADSSLRASKDLRFEMEIRTPEFKKALQDTVEKIVSYVKESKLKELGDRLYYPDDVGSHEQVASQFMMKINSVMSDCGKPVYGDVNSLDVTDAKWIVIQLKCSNKFVHFAFVRTNGKLLLNDVDVAGMK